MNRPEPAPSPMEIRLREALDLVEEGILAPGFEELWQEAQHRCRNQPAGTWLTRSWRPRSHALALTASLAVAAVLFFLSTSRLQERYTGETAILPQGELVNMTSWQAPTDSLLYVDSMRYNREYLTLATYDPVTMEIRE